MTDTHRIWTAEELERGMEPPPLAGGEEPFVRIRDLRRAFGGREVLRGVDLDVRRGETLAILGLSGSGKTTLLKHLTGSLHVEQGSVTIGGVELAALDEAGWSRHRRRTGVVFQHAALLGSLTVEENLTLPLREVLGLDRATCRSRAEAALRRVLLDPAQTLHLKPSELSGGMRKRVGLARALVGTPELVLYDEPTTGLDPVTVAAVGHLVRAQQRALGVTSVVITHDLQLAAHIADRVAMLYKGRIVACDTLAALADHPHPALRQLLTGSVDGPLTEGLGPQPETP